MYDLILKNGLVVDGSRAKPYRADIGIQNGRVAKIAAQVTETAKTVLDAAGLVVTPGFARWWIIPRRVSCIRVLPLKSQETAGFLFYPIRRSAGGPIRSIFSISWNCPRVICRWRGFMI